MLPRLLSRGQALASASSEDVCRSLATVFAAAGCAYLPCILRPELSGHWGSLLQVWLWVRSDAMLGCALLLMLALLELLVLLAVVLVVLMLVSIGHLRRYQVPVPYRLYRGTHVRLALPAGASVLLIPTFVR